jgi:hypothetical protein
VSKTPEQFIALALEDLELSSREAQAALADEDAYQAWGAIYDARVAAEAAERQVIALMQQLGIVTWQSIGEAYGISKQAAHQRWGGR